MEIQCFLATMIPGRLRQLQFLFLTPLCITL